MTELLKNPLVGKYLTIGVSLACKVGRLPERMGFDL